MDEEVFFHKGVTNTPGKASRKKGLILVQSTTKKTNDQPRDNVRAGVCGKRKVFISNIFPKKHPK